MGGAAGRVDIPWR